MERPFSLYADLRLPPDAPPAAVEWAYRRLMKRHHPDHAGPQSAARAAEINAAYSVLRDPDRRAVYDRREHARRHAMWAAAVQRIERRRRVVRGGVLLTAAVVLGAGIPLGANWYDGGIVPQHSVAAASPAAAAVEPASDDALESPDPLEHVADFLARAQAGLPAPHVTVPPKPAAAPAPAKRQVAAASPRVDVPVRMRRAAAEPSRASAQSPEADFLEREGFIY